MGIMLLNTLENQLNPNHPLKIFHTRRLLTASSLLLLSFHGSKNVFSAKSISLGLMAAEINNA